MKSIDAYWDKVTTPIQYNLASLTKERQEALIREGLTHADDVKVDQLDCSQSFRRQPTDKTIDQVLELCLADSRIFATLIGRMLNEPHFELVVSTMAQTPEYFLWIRLSLEAAGDLVDKYNLQPATQHGNI